MRPLLEMLIMRFPWSVLLKTLGEQFSNRSAPSVDGEICAVDKTGTIRRQEDNGFGNLVRCSPTAGWRLCASCSRASPIVRAFGTRRSRVTVLTRTPLGAIFSHPRFSQEITGGLTRYVKGT